MRLRGRVGVGWSGGVREALFEGGDLEAEGAQLLADCGEGGVCVVIAFDEQGGDAGGEYSEDADAAESSIRRRARGRPE